MKRLVLVVALWAAPMVVQDYYDVAGMTGAWSALKR
jgi:hypothetical protein